MSHQGQSEQALDMRGDTEAAMERRAGRVFLFAKSAFHAGARHATCRRRALISAV
jgi:hypothetical protein